MQRTPVAARTIKHSFAAVITTSCGRKHRQARALWSVPSASERAAPVSALRDDICKKMTGLRVGEEKHCDDTIRILRGHGFDDNVIANAILRAPRILEVKTQLNDLLGFWRGLFSSEDCFLKALGSHPELLYLKPSAVESRRAEMFAVFPKRDMNKLLEHCPRVFVDSWEEVLSKINYIVLDMGIQQGPIARSKVLNYSLLHIKTRHLFLLRCGIYKTPKPKERQTKNPSLTKIVETSTEDFVRLSGLTTQEYAVFEKLVPIYDIADEDGTDDELD